VKRSRTGTGEMAELLAVPELWAREVTRDGHLPHINLGLYRRYDRAESETWLSDQ
jgi:excisionase family DNA binding protein